LLNAKIGFSDSGSNSAAATNLCYLRSSAFYCAPGVYAFRIGFFTTSTFAINCIRESTYFAFDDPLYCEQVFDCKFAL